MTRRSQYFDSFTVALVALKVVDVSLERIEEALKKIDSDNGNTMSSLSDRATFECACSRRPK